MSSVNDRVRTNKNDKLTSDPSNDRSISYKLIIANCNGDYSTKNR